MKKKYKQFVGMAVLSLGAISTLAQGISVNFNSYTAPAVISENTSSGSAVSKRVILQDSGSTGTFAVWGSAGTSGSYYGIKILGDNTGNNYLNLSGTKGEKAYNLMAQVGTVDGKPLSESWSVKTRFSATAGNGSLYFGTYASRKMTALGGYDFNQLIVGGTNAAASALALAIKNDGSAVVTRTAANNKHEFWNGSKWVTSGQNAYAATGLDVTGKKQYELTISNDSTTMNLSLVDASDATSLINVDSAVAELGSNITSANTVRFSAGDIAMNSTDGWTANIYSLSWK